MKAKKKVYDAGAICGGVVSQSLFDSDPWAYMMAYVMPDKAFKEYAKAKRAGMVKRAEQLFDQFARSVI